MKKRILPRKDSIKMKYLLEIKKQRFYSISIAIFIAYVLLLVIASQFQEHTALYQHLVSSGFGILTSLYAVGILVYYWNKQLIFSLFSIVLQPLLILAIFICLGFALPKIEYRADDLSYLVERVKVSAVILYSYSRFTPYVSLFCAIIAIAHKVATAIMERTGKPNIQ